MGKIRLFAFPCRTAFGDLYYVYVRLYGDGKYAASAVARSLIDGRECYTRSLDDLDRTNRIRVFLENYL